MSRPIRQLATFDRRVAQMEAVKEVVANSPVTERYWALSIPRKLTPQTIARKILALRNA